jgi:hypothetical protein
MLNFDLSKMFVPQSLEPVNELFYMKKKKKTSQVSEEYKTLHRNIALHYAGGLNLNK